MKTILGKKIRMTQTFDGKGDVVPVTLIEAGQCKILQVKTKERDGYDAIQVGFEPLIKERQRKKSQRGKEFRFVREFRVDKGGVSDWKEYKAGDMIDVSVFQPGDKVKISGISKGKGFQGGVKRWGFSGRNASHGVKHEQRTLGSVGSSGPSRVVKGKKMPGRMGFERTTVRNLEVVKIDKDHNLLAVKGAVPGTPERLLEIRG